MRMKLYRVVQEDGPDMYIVASRADDIPAIFISHAVAEGKPLCIFATEPIDDALPTNQMKGLGDILGLGRNGIAEFEEPFGWRMTQVYHRGMSLFRVNDGLGSDSYVVATDTTMAAAVYMLLGDPDPEHAVDIIDVTDDQPEDRMNGLDLTLTLAPAGLAAWDDDKGWHITQPY